MDHLKYVPPHQGSLRHGSMQILPLITSRVPCAGPCFCRPTASLPFSVLTRTRITRTKLATRTRTPWLRRTAPEQPEASGSLPWGAPGPVVHFIFRTRLKRRFTQLASRKRCEVFSPDTGAPSGQTNCGTAADHTITKLKVASVHAPAKQARSTTAASMHRQHDPHSDSFGQHLVVRKTRASRRRLRARQRLEIRGGRGPRYPEYPIQGPPSTSRRPGSVCPELLGLNQFICSCRDPDQYTGGLRISRRTLHLHALP